MNPKEAAKLYQVQRKLKKEIVEVEAGNGAVTIKVSGDQKVKDVSIDWDKVGDRQDKLEKWLESAITQAITKSQQVATEKMQDIAGDIDLPGM